MQAIAWRKAIRLEPTFSDERESLRGACTELSACRDRKLSTPFRLMPHRPFAADRPVLHRDQAGPETADAPRPAADRLPPGHRRVNETAVAHERVVEHELGAERGQMEAHHRQVTCGAEMDHRH